MVTNRAMMACHCKDIRSLPDSFSHKFWLVCVLVVFELEDLEIHVVDSMDDGAKRTN